MKQNEVWVSNRINELIADVNYYIDHGIDKDMAIKLVRESTTLSDKLFQKVINTFDI